MSTLIPPYAAYSISKAHKSSPVASTFESFQECIWLAGQLTGSAVGSLVWTIWVGAEDIFMCVDWKKKSMRIVFKFSTGRVQFLYKHFHLK